MPADWSNIGFKIWLAVAAAHKVILQQVSAVQALYGPWISSVGKKLFKISPATELVFYPKWIEHVVLFRI